MSTFWVSILVGIIVGYLAKRVRGEGPHGLFGDLVVAIIGAFLAGRILGYFGSPGVVGSIIVTAVGAVVFLWGLRVMTRNGPMTEETSAKMKFGVWALIAGAIVATVTGFAWGGWSTAGRSQHRAEEAVLATRAAICVAQFMKAPNHQARLKELKGVNTWERPAVIEKGGWDRMPGEATASYTVSRACADGLEVLLK